ncbi:hypothetical protein H1C71_018977 [Ictidomys tridecemlineatus]|nr:hypothetical protein H1C71_018977 [Ictidomys tridecemlineatus]
MLGWEAEAGVSPAVSADSRLPTRRQISLRLVPSLGSFGLIFTIQEFGLYSKDEEKTDSGGFSAGSSLLYLCLKLTSLQRRRKNCKALEWTQKTQLQTWSSPAGEERRAEAVSCLACRGVREQTHGLE